MSDSQDTQAGTSLSEYMQQLGQQAKAASLQLARISTAQKNQALMASANQLLEQQSAILKANAKDVTAGKENGLSDALLDRLELTPARIEAMAEGLRQVASLPDPVGEVTDLSYRPSGIQVGKMRMPLGVIGIIYESRPNVTADAAALCLKSGNVAILRGGSEAFHSNQAIAQCLHQGLQDAGLDPACIQVLNTTDRKAVGELITLNDYVDIIIPRGGKGLIERISREASVPVIKHLDGICHVYIDDEADAAKAIAVAENAKTRRYGICGAMETLLIARSKVGATLPDLAQRFQAKGVELRCCPESLSWVKGGVEAQEADWSTEYLAPILSIRVVDGLDQAIEHINTYGSHHTDSIMTEALAPAQRFMREVDSSSVMVNASTQFADGFEYGLGAEIGISTDKLHVRGPVGLEGLTCQKYIVLGDGNIRT